MVNQNEFWHEIRKKRLKHHRAPRVVPAFTIQALQHNTVVAKPPKCNILKQRPRVGSTFRKYYERSAIPVSLEGDRATQRMIWKINTDEVDYHFYLPLFFDGLTETKMPYTFLVEQGITDLLEGGSVKVLPVIPLLVLPIKRALETRIPETVCRTLRILQRLVRCGDCVGEMLVPYFRQILPVLNLLKDRNVNTGGGIDYSQQRGDNVSDLIQETLEILEQYGGEDAFINIKYVIPTYESCIKNCYV